MAKNRRSAQTKMEITGSPSGFQPHPPKANMMKKNKLPKIRISVHFHLFLEHRRKRDVSVWSHCFSKIMRSGGTSAPCRVCAIGAPTEGPSVSLHERPVFGEFCRLFHLFSSCSTSLYKVIPGLQSVDKMPQHIPKPVPCKIPSRDNLEAQFPEMISPTEDHPSGCQQHRTSKDNA